MLFCHQHGTTYRALSADATTAYGLSPVFAIHDELGQVVGPRSELYDAVETAMGAHKEPLSIIISTQAPSDGDLLSTLIDDAKVGADPKIKLFLHSSDIEDDIHDPETWRKANPALGDFRSLEDIKESAENARRLPSFESSFRNLFLNQRVAAKDNLVSRNVWELNTGEVDPSVFAERPVYAGLDLSSRQDLTALVLVARDDELRCHVQCHFYAPEEGLRERATRDRAPYDLWQRQGLLIATPGRSIDYAWVAAKIGEIVSDYDVRAIAFDRWRIDDLKRELGERGIEAPPEDGGWSWPVRPVRSGGEGLIGQGFAHHTTGQTCATAPVPRAAADPLGFPRLEAAGRTGHVLAVPGDLQLDVGLRPQAAVPARAPGGVPAAVVHHEHMRPTGSGSRSAALWIASYRLAASSR